MYIEENSRSNSRRIDVFQNSIDLSEEEKVDLPDTTPKEKADHSILQIIENPFKQNKDNNDKRDINEKLRQ